MKFNDKTTVFRFRVTAEQRNKLIALSQSTGLTVSEIIRQMINKLPEVQTHGNK